MITLPISTNAAGVRGARQGEWTIADWESLPDDGNRYEIIEGCLYVTTAPSNFHQWIIQNLYEFVGIPAKHLGIGIPFVAPIGVILSSGDGVQPDFVIVLKRNASIIYDGKIRGTPDLIIEVISPGSRDYDEDVKLRVYERAGVPEYGVVDPAQRQLRLYRLQADGTYARAEIYVESDTVAFNTLPAVILRVGDLFAGAPDTTL
jgi:Uma2 family endonuclease